MARRKRGRPISGWLILDKNYDVGSTEAVSAARRLYDAKKAGHAGTLDPLATGILPIAFGEATKTVPYVQDGEKTYRFGARFGVATSTDDAEGEIITRSDVRPDTDDIIAALDWFTGHIEQRPPAFSAVKIGGERAYDLARAGEEVELQARPAFVREFRLISRESPDVALFEARTGKGVYVRSLVRDLAVALGAVAHVSSLRRTAVGPFTEEDAVKLSDIEGLESIEERDAELLGLEAALGDLPRARIDRGAAARLARGQSCVLAPADARGVRAGTSGRLEAVYVECDDAPVAICALDGLALEPFRVFGGAG